MEKACPVEEHEQRMKDLERHQADLEARMREAVDSVARLEERNLAVMDILTEIKSMFKESNREIKAALDTFADRNAADLARVDADKDAKISALTEQVEVLTRKPGRVWDKLKENVGIAAISASVGFLASKIFN